MLFYNPNDKSTFEKDYALARNTAIVSLLPKWVKAVILIIAFFMVWAMAVLSGETFCSYAWLGISRFFGAIWLIISAIGTIVWYLITSFATTFW